MKPLTNVRPCLMTTKAWINGNFRIAAKRLLAFHVDSEFHPWPVAISSNTAMAMAAGRSSANGLYAAICRRTSRIQAGLFPHNCNSVVRTMPLPA